jgi:hypothetical protein
VWKIVGAAVGVVALGAAALVVLLVRDDDSRRDTAPQRPQPPVRVGDPVTIDGIAYVVDGVVTAHTPLEVLDARPGPAGGSVSLDGPGGERFWLIIMLALRNTTTNVSASTDVPPRLVGGDGRAYEVGRRYSDLLFVSDLRPGFFERRRLAFYIPRRAARNARLQLRDCARDSQSTRSPCRSVELELGLDWFGDAS